MALKKLFQAKAHRERAQPAAREKLGLLEKKKDYILRAKDFHKKEKRLMAMRAKAAMKNPDEFYFGMINATTSKGVHTKGDYNKTIPQDVLKLMKSQDLTYIQMQKMVNAKKLERLRGELPMSLAGEEGQEAQHLIFAEDDEEKVEILQQYLLPEHGSDEESEDEAEETTDIKSKPSKALLEYTARKERLEALELAEKKLINQRYIMQPGRRKIVGTDEYGHPIFKWRAQRKK